MQRAWRRYCAGGGRGRGEGKKRRIQGGSRAQQRHCSKHRPSPKQRIPTGAAGETQLTFRTSSMAPLSSPVASRGSCSHTKARSMSTASRTRRCASASDSFLARMLLSGGWGARRRAQAGGCRLGFGKRIRCLARGTSEAKALARNQSTTAHIKHMGQRQPKEGAAGGALTST